MTANSWDIRAQMLQAVVWRHDGTLLRFIGIYILYNWREIFQRFFSSSGPEHEEMSLSCKGLTDNTRKGHLSLLASMRQTGRGKHHQQTPIWQTKYCDRTRSHRKGGDATSLLSGFKICSAALHTLFSIELAVQNRFNQLKWHCCRLAVKWKY